MDISHTNANIVEKVMQVNMLSLWMARLPDEIIRIYFKQNILILILISICFFK